ncbi:ATPase BadF/BadG/BcrA/BcrD type [Kribbella flavida DSM 17836]|uniref:ATPase BadF/BadG/BcrA/BcrD type n=1 Tax=Kribbella flavida (strain DSM 17836 / JCM 10339 / NBRC 14399) TaxID=479435 RepID=D2Q4A2_KRIFD|nr:BadF/BadG/BcrA/BcrD ATPase family protein [Kribbella flavida]ADB30416.1 ATPase BadF/BadG/BcrA/BcrD type [Kribbella flavida DSM 17836]
MPVERPLPEPRGTVVLIPAGALVLGGDLGGTSTRIAIADLEGNVVGRGAAAGGNPTSHPASAAANFGQAIQQALAGLDPAHPVDPAMVKTAVIGVAGGSALSRPEVRAQFDAAWSGAGLVCEPQYIGDLEVAFASGTPAADGAVLIAGTGSNAGLVRDHRLVRTADGHGWLLGDDGSGFWLGREAMRSVLRALDLGEPIGPLGEAVVRAVLPNRDETAVAEREGYDRLRDDLIRTVNSRPPVLLAELARTVVTACDAGDETAYALVKRAAELLTETVGRLRTTSDNGPLVLAGSVAGESSPVGRLIRQSIRDHFDGEVLTARDGVGGATWLALGALDPGLASGENHTRLVTPPA